MALSCVRALHFRACEEFLIDATSNSDPQRQDTWLLPAKTRWPTLPEGYRHRVARETAILRRVEQNQRFDEIAHTPTVTPSVHCSTAAPVSQWLEPPLVMSC